MSENRHFVLLLIVVLIGTVVQIATDIYTPSLPAIAHYFKTTVGQSQFTMVFFMAGVGATTLIYGPVSEGIGRKWTIMIGLSIGILGTILCLIAPSIEFLQFARLVQGCGLGACNTLWRTIFRDSFSGKELVRNSSYLVVAVTASVIIAPFIGGYIEEYFGWKMTFTVLCVWIVVVLALVVCFFKETSVAHDKSKLKLRFLLDSYKELIMDRTFMSYTAMCFLCYGGLFAGIVGLPVILIHGAGISPVSFGHWMMLAGFCSGLSGYMSGKLVKKMELNTLLTIGLALMVFAGVFLLFGFKYWGLNVYLVMVSAIIFVIGTPVVFMNCFALSFENVGHIAGYAGSLYSCIQLLGGVFFSTILGHLDTNSPMPLGMMYIFSGVAALLVYKLAVVKGKSN